MDEFDRGGMRLARETDHSPLNGSRLSDQGVKAENRMRFIKGLTGLLGNTHQKHRSLGTQGSPRSSPGHDANGFDGGGVHHERLSRVPLLSLADHRLPVRCLDAAFRAVSAQGSSNCSAQRTQRRAALTRWLEWSRLITRLVPWICHQKSRHLQKPQQNMVEAAGIEPAS